MFFRVSVVTIVVIVFVLKLDWAKLKQKYRLQKRLRNHKRTEKLLQQNLRIIKELEKN